MTEELAQHTTQRSGRGGCRNTLVNTGRAGMESSKEEGAQETSTTQTTAPQNLIRAIDGMTALIASKSGRLHVSSHAP
jgi:hypothetical protein